MAEIAKLCRQASDLEQLTSLKRKEKALFVKIGISAASKEHVGLKAPQL